MKIGIVTQPLYNNYGGLLQNYALQQVLKRLGHEVKTIDFVGRTSFTRYLLSICKQLLIAILKRRRPQIRPYVAIPTFRNPIMADFVNNHIDRTRIVHSYNKKIVSEEHFDAVITGSDQVWRPMYNRYIEDMFLKFVPDSIKKIAYAASFGVDTWEYNVLQTKRCTKYVKRLDTVSVREATGVELCKTYLGVNAQHVLDPTILAGAEAYKPLLKEKTEEQDYLFAYILDITPEKQAYVENMAKSKGLKAIIKSADKNATLSVEDWLSMIANSSMVVTDSFHGTVFSILFHRDFYSIVNVARGGTRFSSLLSPLGLEHRMGDVSQFTLTEPSPIDWQQVDIILDKHRQDSMNFLTNALKK
jgi:hypothetical protein